jgi:hypothetical protein
MCKQCLVNDARESRERDDKIPFYIPGMQSDEEFIEDNYGDRACWIYDLWHRLNIWLDERGEL